MRVAVAGGTGLVGRYVVEELASSGHEPVVLARSRGVDLLSGSGLDAALAGADAVLDVSNVTTTRRATAMDFFPTVTRHLLAAGSRAGVRHHVVLSIVAVDRIPFGYYEAKRRQEELALAGPVPATVLRATQLHEFADQTLARVPGPVALVPRMRVQPVGAGEVAAMLAELAVAVPRGTAPELAGPEVHELPDLARRVLRARGRRRAVVPFRMPGAAGAAMAGGALLPQGGGVRGSLTFSEWLAAETT